MATGDIATRSNNFGQTITDISSLLTLFKGTTNNSNSNTNQTTSEEVSPEKAAALLEAMLGSVAGLANVASGQKQAGGYDSTTNQLLVNDLLSSTAGEIAKLSSVKKATGTTTGTTGTEPLASVSGAGKVLGALQAGSSLYSTIAGTGGAAGGSGLFGSIGSLFGGSSAAGTAGTIGATAATTGTAAGTAVAGTGAASTALSGVASAGSSTVGGLGYYTSLLLAAKAPGMVGKALGVKELESLQDNLIDKPTELIAKPIKKAVKKWIICTELFHQRRLPKKYYIPGLKIFNSYSEQEKQGYYLWAIPCVYHLRKHPYSLWSRFMCLIFNIRAEHIAAGVGIPEAKKSITGAITEYLGRRVCRVLGKFCKYRDYTVVYTAVGE